MTLQSNLYNISFLHFYISSPKKSEAQTLANFPPNYMLLVWGDLRIDLYVKMIGSQFVIDDPRHINDICPLNKVLGMRKIKQD